MAASKKPMIGYQATEEEVRQLDIYWTAMGVDSRSKFLRQLVERELAGMGPPPSPAPPIPPSPPPAPSQDIRQELAALGYVLLSCLQKCNSSEAAKGLIQKFYLSGAAWDQLKEGGE